MLKKIAVASILVLSIIACLVSTPLFAAAQSDVMTGVTTAKRMIVNHNIQQAKQQAVSDALDVALQNAYANLVSRQVFASNLEFFYDKILSRTADYIITYRVLGGIENKGFYLVGVESKVDVKLLEKTMTDARILNENNDKPVIVFFIVEKMPIDLLPKYWWGKNPIPYKSFAEEVIIDKMLQERFVVVGNTSERPDPQFYNITFKSIYDVSAAKDLAREMKADMMIFGKASSSEAINRMGEEKTFYAEINLDAYNVETGEKAFVSQVQAVAKSDMDQEGNFQATIKAADLSSQDLIEKMDAYWQQNLRKEHAFDVRLEGEKFLSRFIAVKKQLRQMPGIENMLPKEVGSNSAVMEIFYKGKPEQFADRIMLKTFKSFGLEILVVTDNLVTIRFIEKGEAPLPKNDSQIQVAPLGESRTNLE